MDYNNLTDEEIITIAIETQAVGGVLQDAIRTRLIELKLLDVIIIGE